MNKLYRNSIRNINTLRIQNNDVELNVLKIASMSEDIGTYK
jgi:hypothetical protein